MGIVSVPDDPEAIPAAYVGQGDICRGMLVQGETRGEGVGKALGRLGVGGGAEVPCGSVTSGPQALNPRALAGVRGDRRGLARFPRVTW